MKKTKKPSDPTAFFKLQKKADGDLPKEDLSEVVKIKPSKPKSKTFTLRLSESEQQLLQDIVTEVNQYSEYKKISANDIIRALIYTGKKMKPENIIRLIKEI